MLSQVFLIDRSPLLFLCAFAPLRELGQFVKSTKHLPLSQTGVWERGSVTRLSAFLIG